MMNSPDNNKRSTSGPGLENFRSGEQQGQLQSYDLPRLVKLGDLRTLTLGGSPGFGDSSVQPQNLPT
jgi:hypothetical protein